jgi:hypothetical protein
VPKPRQSFLSADGESTRPCRIDISSTSYPRPQRAEEGTLNASESKDANPRGYADSTRSASFPTDGNKIMARFATTWPCTGHSDRLRRFLAALDGSGWRAPRARSPITAGAAPATEHMSFRNPPDPGRHGTPWRITYAPLISLVHPTLGALEASRVFLWQCRDQY